jgi:Zn-dependent peptidase ImmA (M78 family)
LDREFCLSSFGTSNCRPSENQAIEIGAEVFAAEFIFPESEFLDQTQNLNIKAGDCSPEDVVRLKRGYGACVSYQFLRKRLIRLGFVGAHDFDRIQFQKLEEQIYGLPIYKQEWFRKRRALKR